MEPPDLHGRRWRLPRSRTNSEGRPKNGFGRWDRHKALSGWTLGLELSARALPARGGCRGANHRAFASDLIEPTQQELTSVALMMVSQCQRSAPCHACHSDCGSQHAPRRTETSKAEEASHRLPNLRAAPSWKWPLRGWPVPRHHRQCPIASSRQRAHRMHTQDFSPDRQRLDAFVALHGITAHLGLWSRHIMRCADSDKTGLGAVMLLKLSQR
jgi:hypothetical protein